MTRLAEADVVDISGKLAIYNAKLEKICGRSLAQIAKAAAGKPEDAPPDPSQRVAIIPITAGMGIISQFCQTLRAIVKFLGYSSYVTQGTDLDGLEESIKNKDDAVIMANDDTFLAINPREQRVSHNNSATARGFAAALNFAAGGLKDKKALLLGAGPVGVCAAQALLEYGAIVCVYDIDTKKSTQLQQQYTNIHVEQSLEQALSRHDFIFDATPAGSFLTKEMLREKSILSAPGVPFCLDEGCRTHMKGRYIHDVLELGTATMLFDVL